MSWKLATSVFRVDQHPQQPAPVYRHAGRHFTRATSSLASLSGLPDLMRVERLKMFIAVSSLCLVDEFFLLCYIAC
jgi:hypothetical protein